MLTAADIESLAIAIGAPSPRQGTLRTIGTIAAERLDATIFTASACRAGSMEIERVFSSTSQVYAVGVLTNKRETQWGRHVLLQQKVFVGEGPLEMAAAFDDQEAMAKVGVRSIINIPIVLRGQCIGVLNFGFANERVSPATLTAVRCLGLAASAAFAAEPAASAGA